MKEYEDEMNLMPSFPYLVGSSAEPILFKSDTPRVGICSTRLTCKTVSEPFGISQKFQFEWYTPILDATLSGWARILF